MDFVVLAKVAIVAIFPNVATAAIEERVVTRAIRELDTGEVSLRHGGLGLKDWFQCEHQKKQSDEREDRLCVKVNAHVSTSNLFSASRGTSQNTAFLRPKARNHCKVIYSRVLGLLRSLSVRMGTDRRASMSEFTHVCRRTYTVVVAVAALAFGRKAAQGGRSQRVRCGLSAETRFP